mgnify:CR=1 FL=1
MSEYHKIQSVFMRDTAARKKYLLEGQWSLPELEYLANSKWTWTEKVDGTNIRIICEEGRVTFGGRAEGSQIPATLVAKLNAIFLPLEETLKIVFAESPHVVLYGEGYGDKIQKIGGQYRSDQSFVLFDVKIGDWWLQRADVEDIAFNLGLGVVPVVGTGTLLEAIEYTKQGFKSKWGDFQAEGLVVRPATELRARSGHRIITKVKHKDFPSSTQQ